MLPTTGPKLFGVVCLALFANFLLLRAPAAQEPTPEEELLPQGPVQQLPPGPEAAAPAQDLTQFESGRIERIAVVGNERIEASTVASYLTVRAGDLFTPESIDASLKTLFATGLFSNVVMERSGNTLIVRVTENPIINRIVFEGNRRLDSEDFSEELELRPRMVYTRAKVRADVQRMIDLYQRSGRFAAIVEPKIIQREQNRVDIVFEIAEGPKSNVRRMLFVGNEAFSDRKLRGVAATNEARWWKFFTSNDTYDPDRIAFDREEIRQHYLDNGHADVRIVSAVAELTPDQRDFIVTYVIEEGPVYTFGDISVESEIKALPPALLEGFIPIQPGQTYNASQVEQSVENITSAAGVVGFAFLDVRPEVERDRENRIISIVFRVLEAPRTYIERIDIHGNVRTLDRVIRREFRVAEGDAYNSVRVQRSEQRLRLLGFFRNVEVEQLPGSAPDRVILDVTVEEQATGEFSLGFGYSSFDNFLIDVSITERNFLGKGQEVALSGFLSRRRKNVSFSFTQPYFLNRNMTAGFQIFRNQLNSRESSFNTRSIGTALRVSFPVTEFITLTPHYTIRRDQVVVPASLIGVSPFIRDQAGTFTTSAVGYNLGYINLDDFRFPSRGARVLFVQSFAGVGGTVKYIRNTIQADYYKPITGEWIMHVGLDAGYIKGLGQRVRINDRFFLGNPKFRGFDVAGIGPVDLVTGDRLGGNIYYVGTVGVAIPLGEFAEELGFQLSAYVDAGTLYKAELPPPAVDDEGNPIPLNPVFDDNVLRISVGIGLIWDSPFGPVRLDIAKAIKKSPFDRTQTIQFNVGTRF